MHHDLVRKVHGRCLRRELIRESLDLSFRVSEDQIGLASTGQKDRAREFGKAGIGGVGLGARFRILPDPADAHADGRRFAITRNQRRW